MASLTFVHALILGGPAERRRGAVIEATRGLRQRHAPRPENPAASEARLMKEARDEAAATEGERLMTH